MARQGNIEYHWTLYSQVKTTVDSDSASGQKVLNVTATTGFSAGDVVEIDSAGAGGGAETATIASVQDGVSLTMVANLTYTHTAAQADIVILQGNYQDVNAGGEEGDGQGNVWRCRHKTILITAASVTDTNGFTVELYGQIRDGDGNLEEVLLHNNPVILAASNGTYAVHVDTHYDDIYAKISNYKDGTLTVQGSGRV